MMDQWLDRAAAFHQTGVIEYLYSMGLGRRPRPQDAAFYRDHVPHRHAFHQARLHGKTGCDPIAAEAHLNAQYAALDRALADQPWLAGNHYSLADIAWFPSIFALGIFGFDPSSYPHLRSWQARIRARPAFASGIKRHLLPIPNPLIRFVLRFNNRFGQRR